jgi:hypothetical protein
MTDSFTRFQSPVERFERVGIAFDALSTIGIVEAMVTGLEDFAGSEQVNQKSKIEDPDVDQVM